jgi:hypothetical protein
MHECRVRGMTTDQKPLQAKCGELMPAGAPGQIGIVKTQHNIAVTALLSSEEMMSRTTKDFLLNHA